MTASVLSDDLKNVRLRPGMYVGGTDSTGLEVMLSEVLGNAIDQHLLGHASRISLQVDDDGWVTVRDDGAGIQLWGERGLRENLTRVFERLHTTPTLDIAGRPHIHVLQLNGLGISVVNALSERFELQTQTGERSCTASWERGELTGVADGVATGPTGTVIRFRPDGELFFGARLNQASLEIRLRELAWLKPKLRFELNGRTFTMGLGLRGWLRDLARDSLRSETLCSGVGSAEGVTAEVAIAWTSSPAAPRVRSFVNLMPTVDGTHHAGLRQAIEQVLPDAPQEGWIAVIATELFDPRFNGPTRAILATAEAQTAVFATARTMFVERAPELTAAFRRARAKR